MRLKILILLFSIFYLSALSACVSKPYTRKSEAENKKHCPDDMILIKKRTFIMGYNAVPDESPAHEVMVDSFCIDKYEFPNIRREHPEVGLNFFDAREKCLNVGKRLCTEAEWELACRGPKNNLYPWGNKINHRVCYIGRIDNYKTGTFNSCYSDYGVYDMSGGVWEWTSDWYKSYPGKVNSFSEEGIKRVLRGGFWLSSFDPAMCTSRFPLEPETNNITTIGTRCCKSLE